MVGRCGWMLLLMYCSVSLFALISSMMSLRSLWRFACIFNIISWGSSATLMPGSLWVGGGNVICPAFTPSAQRFMISWLFWSLLLPMSVHPACINELARRGASFRLINRSMSLVKRL